MAFLFVVVVSQRTSPVVIPGDGSHRPFHIPKRRVLVNLGKDIFWSPRQIQGDHF